MNTLIDLSSRRGKGQGFQSLEDALWSRVIPGLDNCLVYVHDTDPYGYGRVSFEGARNKAHRVAWALRFGELPEKMELDHRPNCDKRCVNVEHLQLLTRSEHQKLTMRRPEERPSHMHPYGIGCTEDGCNRPRYGKGLCQLHWRRTKEMI